MNITIENIILMGSILLFISIIVGKTSYRFGVPTLLLFLAIGMLAGSEGIGGIRFDNPGAAQFIGVIALNFILFNGGLETSFTEIKPIIREGLVLSTFGVLLTALILGGFIYYVFEEFSFYESMLLGSIVSSTDAAAVFSILRSRRMALKTNLRPTLELESGSNDPMAYVLTIAFLTLVMNQDQSIWSIVPMFFRQMILGIIFGFGFGLISKIIVNRINLSFNGLYPVLVIALMFITFSATDFLGGNGFLAIYICGLYLGNQDIIQKKTILQMYDGLAWLMQIVLFLTLGLLVFPSQVVSVLGIGLIISAFLIFAARPIAVFLSLMFFKMSLKRRVYISWVGLRGAVPIVFATYPLIAGIQQANMIFNIVFFISVTSVLIQGTSLSKVAKWLDVAMPREEKKITEVDKFLSNIPRAAIKEIEITPGSFAIDKKIVSLGIPKDTVIAMIQRDGKYFIPTGSMKIMENDKLVLLSESEKGLESIREFFYMDGEEVEVG